MKAVIPAVVSLLLLCASAEARVLYVDAALPADCSDGSYSVAIRDCVGSDGSGYSTFAPAIAAMQAGDVLMIRGGTYMDPLNIDKSGTSTAHLRIAAYPGEWPAIDLSALAPGTDVNGINASRQSYIDIDGINVYNSPYYGAKGSGGQYITLTNCEIAYSANGSVIFEYASNIVVSGCNVHHNNSAGPGSVMEAMSFLGAEQFQVINCDVHDNGKEGIVAKYGSTNGVISGNRSYANNGPNIYLDSVNSIQVSRNVCHGTASNKACIGLSIESTYNIGGDSAHDILIDNNVIYGSGAGLWFWVESPDASFSVFSNIRIEYNTIADNTLNSIGAGIYFLNGGSANFGDGNIIRSNIIWNNSGTGIEDSGGAAWSFTIDHNLFLVDEWSSTTGTSAVVSSINPFVDVAVSDYRLADYSPARGVGQPEPDITTDLVGTPRPSAVTDVGAYQYPLVLDPAPSPNP